MHGLNTQLEENNHNWVLGLSRNLFCVLQNNPTLVGETHRGNGWECIIYSRLTILNILIVTEFCCDGFGWQNFCDRGKTLSKRPDSYLFESLHYIAFVTYWGF